MTVPALVAAKHLARASNWRLSNLQLQKILYLAHMVHLSQTGERLVDGHFEAWDYGPVHPSVYHQAKIFGKDPVGNIFHSVPDLGNGSERATLDEALTSLGGMSGGQLVNITHRPGGAWDKNFHPGYRSAVIPDQDIIQEFETW